MAEPAEVVSESYKWGTGVALVALLLKTLVPTGYHFKFIRLYAERDEPPNPTPEEADDETS